MQLQPESLLQGGKYKIESTIGQGGFGITYLATTRVQVQGVLGELETEIKVAIKEFFMKDVCNRDSTSHVSVPSVGSKEMVERFKQKFVKEAKNISLLKHPNIVKVLDIFEENGTAYYVMEYIQGGSLQQYIADNGPLSEIESLRYIREVANALIYIHSQHMNHLDVKPGNILRRNNSDAVLIDFGLSKRYDKEGHQTSTTPIGISTGYAPMEQYKKGGVGTFSPATDVYSLGATLYKLLTGETPPDASEVFDDGLPELPDTMSANVRKAILLAMEPKRCDRPQSIEEFLALLDGKNGNEDTITIEEEEEKEEVVEKKNEDKKEQKISPNRKILLMIGVTVCVALIVLIGVIGWQSSTPAPPANSNEPSAGQLIDLGLSVKWAAYNVGASSPEGYGRLYGWADPTGEKRTENNNDYPSSNPPKNISGTQYDIARAKWGGNWRLPKHEELIELSERCDWKWIKYKGVNGYLVTGPNGNRIFLPAAGWRCGNGSGCNSGSSGYGQMKTLYEITYGGGCNSGNSGYYWSGTLELSDNTYYHLYFDSGHRFSLDGSGRYYEFSVRPVSE